MSRVFPLAKFLLRTFYFSPANNPVWFVLAPMALVYVMTGLMGHHEVLLFMLAAAATHRFMRSFRGGRPRDGLDPLRAAFRLLPVSQREIRTATALSVGLYALVLGIGFTGLLLVVQPSPPWIEPPETQHMALPTGDTVTYYTGHIMDRTGAHHVPRPFRYIPPLSAAVDSFRKLPVWPLWILAAFLGLLLNDAWLHYRPPRSHALEKGLAHGLLALHGAMAVALMADKVLPKPWRLFLTVRPEQTWVLAAIVLGTALIGIGFWVQLALRREADHA